MAGNIYLSEEEEKTLRWILQLYEETHVESWREGVTPEEEAIVGKLRRKIG